MPLNEEQQLRDGVVELREKLACADDDGSIPFTRSSYFKVLRGTVVPNWRKWERLGNDPQGVHEQVAGTGHSETSGFPQLSTDRNSTVFL